MLRTACALLLLVAGTGPCLARPTAAVDGVVHYTTHATGMFNEDQHEDMIISCSSGHAFLLLGTGTGYQWRELQEQPVAEAEVPASWPADSQLFVRRSGSGFEVFTRDVRGQVHRFTTAT